MTELAELFDPRLFLLAALIFIPLERLFGLNKSQKLLRRGWANDIVYVFVNGLLIRLGLAALVALFLLLSPLLVPAPFHDAVGAQPLWLQFVEIVLLTDLGFYAMHRLFHTVPALWRLHQVHHSIEEMDWLAAARVHPIDQILTKGVSLLPCFALGLSPWAVAAFAIVYYWHSLLLHSNLRLSFGPLDRLIASPRFHHWHHCRDREAWDRNFAGQLALWDHVFGTAYLPKGRRAERFGIGEAMPEAYAAQLVHPFRRAAEVRSPGSAAAQGNG